MTQSSIRTSHTGRRGSQYDPWGHAHSLGLTIAFRPLRTAHELWIPEHNTLVIKEGMRAVHQRNALAHGLGHAELAHVDMRPKHEKQADQFAARNLICPDELADLHRWAPDEAALAMELGVTVRLLRVYLRKPA